MKKIKLKRRFVVFKAYRKIEADSYHQYRIDGKIVSWKEYCEKRTKMIMHGCWPYKSYTQCFGNGKLVDVYILS